MEATTIAGLIGAGGTALGAIIAAIASAYTANRKLKEIKLAYVHKVDEMERNYLQKRRDNQLKNAKEFTTSIYLPINLLLTELSTNYEEFRAKVNFENETSEQDDLNKFRNECCLYIESINELNRKGADAYLITSLDERLRSFNTFIINSINANVVTRKMILKFNTSLFGNVKFPEISRSIRRKTTKETLPSVSFSVGGLSFAYSEDEILTAPLTSRAFEERIQVEIPALKFLIKEVTLGSDISKS